MGYLHFSITGTTAADNIELTGLKLARISSDFAQADDLYTIDCPDGSTLTLDEAGAETASLTTAGVSFSSTANEAFVLTEASLIAGFPTASAGALVKGGVNVAGSAISLTEGLFCIQYNNDSADIIQNSTNFIRDTFGQFDSIECWEPNIFGKSSICVYANTHCFRV